MGRRKIIEDEQLLAKARDIFVREGIGVGSRQLANEIGISSSVLFQRFGSKEELFFAAMTPPTPDIAALLAHDDPAQSAEAWTARIAAGLLDYFRQFAPVLAALASHPAFDYPTFARRHPQASLETLLDELRTAMVDQHRRGAIDCADVGPVVLNLVAFSYALAVFERIGAHDAQVNQDMVQALTHLLWRGIAPRDHLDPTEGHPSPPPHSG